MVKKRGGRRGKKPTNQDNSPTDSEATPQAAPSVSTSPSPQPMASQATSQTPPASAQAPPPLSPTPVSQPMASQAAQYFGTHESQAWGRGRGVPLQKREVGLLNPPIRRQEPVGVASEKPRDKSQAWGRGRGIGRGVPLQTSEVGLPNPPIRRQEPVGVAPEEPIKQPQPTVGVPQPTASTGEGSKVFARQLTLDEMEANRPFKAGTLGRKITIETNHFRLDLGDVTTVYRYDVAITPEKKPRQMYRNAMEVFRKSYYPQNFPSYDGQKLLYSARRLPFGDHISGKVIIQSESGSQEFDVKVKLTGTLDLSPLRNLLQKNYYNSQEEAFQCVEVVLRQAYISSFVTCGRRFYTPGDRHPLGAGATMYLGGFKATVRGYQPLVNVDVAHRAFTTATPLVNLIVDMCGTRKNQLSIQNLAQFRLQYHQIEQINNYLKGLKVVYEVQNMKKVYRVNSLKRTAMEETFKLEGREFSVAGYFKQKYRVDLRFPNLPTVWVGNQKNKILVPMEFCTLKEGQILEGTHLLPTQTAKMIKYTASPTNERRDKIQTVLQKSNSNTHPCIREFGFNVDPNFIKLTGRVLDPPVLEYSKGTVSPQGGQWRGKTFKKGARIDNWTIINYGVTDVKINSGMMNLENSLIQHGRSNGIFFSDAKKPFHFVKDRKCLSSCLRDKTGLQLVVVVIPYFKDNYHDVKQEAELTYGILTQCIKHDTVLDKLNQSTVTNILLKINAKMNGINHILGNLTLLNGKRCMVMGADVTHPSPQARTIPSVAAVTSSVNLSATTYSTSIYMQVPQNSMSEIITDLENITLEKLKNFETPPEVILFFRDGVSEGQFEAVKQFEVQAIKNACASFSSDPECQPKVTFVVVQKRHHTRFFPTDSDSTAVNDKNLNVPVGTCVDTVINDYTMMNYFLMSHQSIKGTGRPAKYTVLYDDNGLTADELQPLTFYLCHLYTRCNRSVSYPAPTYFAHLAADRGKTYIRNKTINFDSLDQRMVKPKEEFLRNNPMYFS